MISRRGFFRFFGLGAFLTGVGWRSITYLVGSPRSPTLSDFEFIDRETRRYLISHHNINIYHGTVKYLREQIQLYSKMYIEKGERFRIYAEPLPWPSLQLSLNKPRQNDVELKDMDEIIRRFSEERGVKLWYSSYSEADYRSLDKFLKERLEGRLGVELDEVCVKFIRQWSQTIHYVYNMIGSFTHDITNVSRYPIEISATGSKKKCSTSIESVVVDGYIKEWEAENKLRNLRWW